MNLAHLFLLICAAHLGWVTATCTDFKNCGSCISYADKRCVWCGQETMGSKKPDRCQLRTEVFKNNEYDAEWCTNKTSDPDSSIGDVFDRPFNAAKGNEVQFRPQKMNVTLRPGVPLAIDMYYQPAQDFPLDMYFLMDNSYTMMKYGKKLADQTIKIYQELSNMTKNVQLGIGSFVEKPALPYADPTVQNTYVFKHHLSLTNDSKKFQKEVEQYYSPTGSNYDSPEAGLDALMQVMTCGDKIGWRHTSNKDGELQSRRIIILATEATYHSAGDGKMVGAYKPNDMQCHLDKDNTYDVQKSLTYDYPSLSQINYIAKKNNFRIVFAVPKYLDSVYNSLAEQIFAASTATLADDELIFIIKNAYISASKNLELQVTNLPKSIKFTSSCDVPENCIITQENPTVHVKALVTAMDCTETSHFEINPFGLSNDKLSINFTVNCKCQCEGIASKLSVKCNNVGVKECGVCKCASDRSGEFCEIECSDSSALMNDCKKFPDDDVAPCNGRGNCVCGKCNCNDNYSGKLCEFDDKRCREKCPKDKGVCNLGQCICKDKSMWTGPECNCLANNIKCIGPFSKEPCSGRGECKCGQCVKCNSIDDKSYFGNYCESCKDCAMELCESLKEYANCNYEKKNKSDCDEKYNQTSVKEVLLMNRTALEAESTASGCRKKLSNDNILVYKYIIIPSTATEPAKIKLMIQDEVELPPVANIWIAIGSVLGGILLVGLLTICIWKISSDIYYKREYEKFCQEATKAGFDVTNPVYQNPNVNFVNPAYSGNGEAS